MKKRPVKLNKQQFIRMIALVLVIFLLGGTVLSILVSAMAEEQPTATHSCELEMDYLENQQALQITQRFVYHNTSDETLDRVIFYAASNMFRRESALIYENDVLESVFPNGFAPAGIDLQSVRCDGQDADWGYQGANEMLLRVSCNIAPGEKALFEMEYYLLLSNNCAMTGVSETDVRLTAFYFVPGVFDETYSEFITHNPLQHTRWLFTDAVDYTVTLTLPDTYLPAGTGSLDLLSTENHRSLWRFEARNVREFALSFGKRYRSYTSTAGTGTTLRILSNDRSASRTALRYASEIIRLYENWFGPFPTNRLDIVQTDYPVETLTHPGLIRIPNALWKDDAALKSALRTSLAQQYFGLAVYPEPVSDAWLSDVVASYISLLAVEELSGYDAFVSALNNQVLSSLNITIPGGLHVTSDASLFTASDYDIVARNRGTVVMHELRVAMGRTPLLDALRNLYSGFAFKGVMGEYDLVHALDSVSDARWEDFLTEWLFHVDDYIDQQPDHYE
ncbi:MAG: hypothetical protein U0L09_03035 [Christensenellales bacterium]|nr:hypothetical protein [Christensenellales bacterium]